MAKTKQDIKNSEVRPSRQLRASEFNPQNPHGGRREPTPASCSLTSICTLWNKCVRTCTHTHKQINATSKSIGIILKTIASA